MFDRLRRVPARAARALLPWLLVSPLGAHAVLITFDDLPPPCTDSFSCEPLTNQYEHLGLVVDNGYLVGSPGHQALLGSVYFSLRFVGQDLPNYVSLYVSAPNQDRVWLTASGPSGYGAEVATQGWGPPEWSTAYRDNQYVSFHSDTGISQINIDAFYFLRVSAVVDNLYFGNVPAVPEPASALALVAGLLVLAGAHRWRRGQPLNVAL